MCSAAFSCRGLGLELMLEVGAGGSIKGEDKESLGKRREGNENRSFPGARASVTIQMIHRRCQSEGENLIATHSVGGDDTFMRLLQRTI